MTVRVIHGDCLDVLPTLSDIDAVCVDPPYHLTSIVKRFGGDNSAPAQFGTDGVFARTSRGFMGKQWDGGDIALRPETWRLVFAAMKPGAHLVAFGGTRTFHRMAVAIEDAGFEIRDTLCWLYSTGFPKSHSVNKALNGTCCGCESPSYPQRDMRYVPNTNVSAPFDVEDKPWQVLFTGVPQQSASVAGRSELSDHAGREQSSMEGWSHLSSPTRELCAGALCEVSDRVPGDGAQGWLRDGTSTGDDAMDKAPVESDGMRPSHRPQSAEQRTQQSGTVADQSESQGSGVWPLCDRCGKPIIPDGFGTALKPAVELICLARKPISERTIAANFLKHGTGGINIDACRVEAGERPLREHTGRDGNIYGAGLEGSRAVGTTTEGRWPANVLHDGSYEVEAAFAAFGDRRSTGDYPSQSDNSGNQSVFGNGLGTQGPIYDDSGTASRFFYCAKADSADRAWSKHPTVKPRALINWLLRMIVPPGGTVLDCFAGSGTTGESATACGFDAILIEREAEYIADIHKRLGRASGADTPLFASAAE